MKQKKRFNPRPLPRPLRIVLCLFACAALLLYVYFADGMPAFSPEHALRRAERRALIGMKGTVLAEREYPIRFNGDRVVYLAAEYGDRAAALFGTARDSMLGSGWSAHNNGAFYIVAKSASGATVMAYPGYPTFDSTFGDDLIIAVFDDYPEAVRAELSLTLTLRDTLEAKFDHTYTLGSQREHDGVFFFNLRYEESSESEDGITTAESDAVSFLAGFAYPASAATDPRFFTGGRVPATVTFFSGDGSVIATVETEVAKALL